MAPVPDEVIDALVPDDQAPVAEGEFTLDLVAAQAKIDRYRLADSEYFVLLLVELGHRLPECTAIEFELSTYATEVRLLGVELDDVELARSTEPSISAQLTSLEPRAAALELLARIVAGVVVARQFKRIELGASSAKRVLRFDNEGAATFHTAGAEAGRAQLWLSFRERARVWLPWGPASEALERRKALIRSHCRYARRPVHLDRQRIDAPRILAEADERFPVEEDGVAVAHVGHTNARFEATMLLIFRGVLIETLVEPELGTYRVAEVDVSDLPRDLSLTRLVESGALAARLERVRAALRKLPTEYANPPSFVGDGLLDEAARNFGLAMMSMLIVPFVTPIFVGMGLLAGRAHAKAARLRQTGEPGVARVEDVEWKTVRKVRKPSRFVLRVFVAGREPYLAEHVPARGFDSSADLFRGARVHVFVDPADPQRIEFAMSEGLSPQLALPPADEDDS